MSARDPIDPQIILLAAAKASVPGSALPALVECVQRHLSAVVHRYERQYETVHRDENIVVCFVPKGHWSDIGDAVGLDRREIDAVRRAHHEQLRRLGRNGGRIEEFETALDIRDAVIIAMEDG